MFSPITDFDADICLIRLKRGIESAARAAVDQVAPLARHHRGGAERHQPSARAQQVVAGRKLLPPSASITTSICGSAFSQPDSV